MHLHWNAYSHDFDGSPTNWYNRIVRLTSHRYKSLVIYDKRYQYKMLVTPKESGGSEFIKLLYNADIQAQTAFRQISHLI